MTSVFGHAHQEEAVAKAFSSGKMHHGWLLTGKRGIGKATFAWAAAQHILSRRPGDDLRVFAPDFGGASGRMLEARNHPDCHYMTLEPRDDKERRNMEAGKDYETRRNIPVDQVRQMQRKLTVRPSLSERRVIIIDSVDDMERGAANALLKSLEEPPEKTLFFLISHNPGRLLPTIRSRCFALAFAPLGETDMRAALRAKNPSLPDRDLSTLSDIGEGSPGHAMQFRDLDMHDIHTLMQKIADGGDRDQRLRLQLAKSLTGKAARQKMSAFLSYAPAFAARICRTRSGDGLAQALTAWEDIMELSVQAPTYNYTAEALVYQIGGLLAQLAPPRVATA